MRASILLYFIEITTLLYCIFIDRDMVRAYFLCCTEFHRYHPYQGDSNYD